MSDPCQMEIALHTGGRDCHRQEAEDVFEKNMKYACILNCYMKRHSNLYLLAHQNGLVGSEELRLSVSESLEYVRMYGVKARLFCCGETVLPGKMLLLAYEVFDDVLEAGFFCVNAMIVWLNIDGGRLVLQMEQNVAKEIPFSCKLAEKIDAVGGTFSKEREGQMEYLSLMLPTGGEAQDALL